jgi:hypothetical protein
VLSILGCTGIGAILGLILGIVGIAATRSGRRRGLGLAIAAIPISLVTGVIGVTVGIGSIAAIGMWSTMMKVPELLKLNDASIAELREITTDDFDNAVDDETLRAWFDEVEAKHGKLVELVPNSPPTTRQQDGRAVFSLPAKFVNGNADISLTFEVENFRTIRIDNIEVDGVSPRPPG